MKLKLFILFFLVLILPVHSQTEISMDFPLDTSLWEVGGSAEVTDIDGINGEDEILLTSNSDYQNGYIKYKDFVNFAQCHSWELEFEFRLWSEGPNSSGDGFAFVLLNQYDEDSGWQNLGIQQHIALLGLVVAFDTHDDCNSNIHDNPEIQISEIDVWHGYSYQENCYPLGNPKNIKLGTGDYDTDIQILRSPNYRKAKFVYYYNSLTVYVDVDNDGSPEQVLGPTLLYLDYNYGMQMAFTASTSDYSDNQSIRNVKLTLDTELVETERTELKCPGESLEINGGIQYLSYEWKDGDGNFLGNDQFLTVDEVGTYTLEKEFFCGVETETITVLENDLAIDSIEQVPNCGYTELIVEASGGQPTYQYAVVGGATLQGWNTIRVYEPGETTVLVRDWTQCYAEKTIMVDFVPDVLNVDLEQISGHEIAANVSGGTPPFEYKFEDRSYSSSNIHEVPSSGTFTITVKDAVECTKQATIDFYCDPYEIPNYFSPNNDGINDRWYPKGLTCYPNLLVEIFDRQGRKLYQFRGDNTLGWDGTYNNKPLPSNDYWYSITLNKFTKPIVGHFNLYR